MTDDDPFGAELGLEREAWNVEMGRSTPRVTWGCLPRPLPLPSQTDE